jgi:exportin-1
VHVFYEAVACMVSAQADAPTRDALLIKLMEWPNQMWCDLLAQAKATNGESLKDPNTMKQLQNIIRTNDRVATALGHPYVVQLGNIYMDLLNIYKACSEMINSAVATAQQSGQAYIMQSSGVRAMRAVKKETLKLLETFIEKSEDNELVLTKFVPPLLDPVLVDYFQGNPDARDPEVGGARASHCAAISCPLPRSTPAPVRCSRSSLG